VYKKESLSVDWKGSTGFTSFAARAAAAALEGLGGDGSEIFGGGHSS